MNKTNYYLKKLSKKFDFGQGEKENFIYKELKDLNIFYLKQIGFVIPSKNKPKKILAVPMYNRFSEIYYNGADLFEEKKDSFTGFLQDTLLVSIVLNVLKQNKSNDTIFVFYEGSMNNKELGLYNFFRTVDKNLLNSLVLINLGLQESNHLHINFSSNYSKSLLNYIQEKKIFNSEIKKISDNFCFSFVSGFDFNLPYKAQRIGRAISVDKTNIRDYAILLTKFINLSYSDLNLSIEIKKSDFKKINNNFCIEFLKEKLSLFKDIKKEEETFLIHYITTKQKERKPILTTFLFKKYGSKVMKFLKLLKEEKFIESDVDGNYRFV